MTKPDYRAMCAELLVLAEESISYRAQVDEAVNLIDRARTLLAQPVPEGPSDEDLVNFRNRATADCCTSRSNNGANLLSGDDLVACQAAGLRAVLARWGHPTPQPPAAGEVAELVEWLSNQVAVYEIAFQSASGATRLRRVAALLSQRHPQPVAVSEPLPGPDDCNAEGKCWWFSPADDLIRFYDVTHWLPANALPTPEATND